MNVLITGGAGYIGSHATRFLLDKGHDVTVLDNLSHGFREAVDPRAEFIHEDICQGKILTEILKKQKIDTVMHFAAFIEVGESVLDPNKYYQNNFVNGLNLLESMKQAYVKKLVFSSTAAVYGTPQRRPGTHLISESDTICPISPYGHTKMMMELAIQDFSKAHGLGYGILRYFNVAGATPDGSMGEAHNPESHLIPRILSVAAGRSEFIQVFGTDYPTKDGTCVRDYIHVEDIAHAHEVVMLSLQPGKGNIYNIGSDRGFSVREVIKAAERVTGKSIPVREVKRREGDPPSLVASSSKISTDLNWKPLYPEVETMISHAWKWHQKFPNGYGKIL